MPAAWAIVVTAVADLRAAPDHTAELVSQRWLGDVLCVLGRRGGWLRVYGWDRRRGWVRSWSVREVGERTARHWERLAVTRTWGQGVVARVTDGTRQPLPWGARVVVQGLAGGWGRVRLPDGRLARVGRRFLRRPVPGDPGELAITTTRAVLGTPYLWGGTTPAGFDCSGLIQWAYALGGVPLPRDAAQQWRACTRVTGVARPGDLVFFGRGRIEHVALLSTPPVFVHAYGRVEEAHPGAGRVSRSAGALPVSRPELGEILVGVRRPPGNSSPARVPAADSLTRKR